MYDEQVYFYSESQNWHGPEQCVHRHNVSGISI